MPALAAPHPAAALLAAAACLLLAASGCSATPSALTTLVDDAATDASATDAAVAATAASDSSPDLSSAVDAGPDPGCDGGYFVALNPASALGAPARMTAACDDAGVPVPSARTRLLGEDCPGSEIIGCGDWKVDLTSACVGAYPSPRGTMQLALVRADGLRLTGSADVTIGYLGGVGQSVQGTFVADVIGSFDGGVTSGGHVDGSFCVLRQ